MTTATTKPREVRCDDCRRLHDEDAACPPPCYQCGGSGEAPYVSPAGVVEWRHPTVDCGACGGTGAERERTRRGETT